MTIEITTPVKFITETGAMYVLEGDRITRLAEHPMEGGDGSLLVDVHLNKALIDGPFMPPLLGLPFRADVLGKPLTTSPVKMIFGDR